MYLLWLLIIKPLFFAFLAAEGLKHRWFEGTEFYTFSPVFACLCVHVWQIFMNIVYIYREMYLKKCKIV